LSSRTARRLALTIVVGVVAVLAGSPGGAVGAGRHHHLPTERISFGEHTCAPHWHAPNKGRSRFLIQNRSHHRATMYLVRLPSGRTVARLSGSKPGTTRPLRVNLRPGTYLWGCYLAGEPSHTSEAERVPVDNTYGGPGAPVVPVSRTDLVGPYREYRRYVADHLATLETQLGTLTSAAGGADRSAAESAWLDAHLTWLEIGQDNAAYGAFGQLGRAIDGTSAGLPGGTADPRFTGFHRVELDLWGGSSLATASDDVAVLEQKVTRLTARPIATWLPASKAGESAWILRVHEVLEDALRDSLSGRDEYGSGSTLASVTADVTATHEVLGLLAPLVRARKPHLVAKVDHRLDHLTAVVAGLRGSSGWPPLASLSRAQHERVDAALDAALEILAPVPDLLPIGSNT
jgi:iron uptake system EfeUOB component EfeO/EfeM